MNPEKNPEHWKCGIFYYNKDDKRIFPPKQNPALGWTVNFANPKSIAVFALLMSFFAMIIYLIERNQSS